MERFAKIAAQALTAVLSHPVNTRDLELPPDPKMGDFGFPCFKLAKEFKRAPAQVATELAERIRGKGPLPHELEVFTVGPYLNFRVPHQAALGALLEDLLKGKDLGTYGSLPADSRGTWVLEYSSPNIAKPFQVYHLRPTALGAAFARIGKFRGFRVISINHLGDWGTQYGKLTVAFKMYKDSLPAHPTIADMVRIYVDFHKACETDPTLEDQAREAFLKLEQGDPEITALWKKCVDVALKEFNGIYDRLNVKFDYFWGESFYKDQMAPLLADFKKRGILEESEGAQVVTVHDDKGNELPPCILQKKDGATIYATRDVAAAIYRYERFHFDRMTYIVGGEQRLHFMQVFAVLKKAGYDWASRCEHVPFGLYRFKDQKMSTRKGNFVTLDDTLLAARARVLDLLKERTAKSPVAFTPAELEDMAEKVAIGAVVFHDLSVDPAKDVEFDLDRVVDFDGETGPYLQYAHTRCLSILRKAQATGELHGSAPVFRPELVTQLERPEEAALVKVLGQFPIHLDRSIEISKASQLSNFLIDVTKAFNTFYRECHVLGQPPELTQARLLLVEATRRILAQGLGLLGVPLPERM